MRVAVCERVEPGAENDVLPHAARYGCGQRVLGEPAAQGDERTQRAHVGSFLDRPRTDRRGVITEDWQRQRVRENRRHVPHLVFGAVAGHALRRGARTSFFHAAAPAAEKCVPAAKSAQCTPKPSA